MVCFEVVMGGGDCMVDVEVVGIDYLCQYVFIDWVDVGVVCIVGGVDVVFVDEGLVGDVQVFGLVLLVGVGVCGGYGCFLFDWMGYCGYICCFYGML